MSAAEALPIRIRAMLDGDIPFVVSTWVNTLKAPHWMPEAEYRSNMRKAVLATVRRCRVVVLCAMHKESSIEGWACGEPGLFHHVYVRPTYFRHDPEQGRRIGDALCKAAMA